MFHGDMINFEDFKKIELRIGKILEAERVEGSEKLVKLMVDMGKTETGEKDIRQIVAGIGKSYQPEKLINKEIAVVANLEPRQLMGIESQAMLLAAINGEPILLVPEKQVPPGSQVK